jgi:hypothetical protein
MRMHSAGNNDYSKHHNLYKYHVLDHNVANTRPLNRGGSVPRAGTAWNTIT